MMSGLMRTSCRLAGALRTPATRAPTRSLPQLGALRKFGGGGDPRGHLNPDGTRPAKEDIEDYHHPDPLDYVPKFHEFEERGQKWIVSGNPPKPLSEVYGVHQDHVPYFSRERLILWGNYKLLMKAEYCFFYIPTIIILGLAVPALTTIYAFEEVVASTMTVKVIGRQWYWVYEVESPTDDGDDDDD